MDAKTRKKTHQFGLFAESLAVAMLSCKFYKIIAKRYKTKFGEVDLIAEKNQTLVFIEVKARKKSELIEVILRQKQIERIKNTAQMFIAQNEKYQNHDIRFDFILFENSFKMQHFEGYFE